MYFKDFSDRFDYIFRTRFPISWPDAWIAYDFLSQQDFDAAPLNAVGDVTTGRALVGQLGGTAKVTLSVVTAALTAGKISVYVAYIEGA